MRLVSKALPLNNRIARPPLDAIELSLTRCAVVLGLGSSRPSIHVSIVQHSGLRTSQRY